MHCWSFRIWLVAIVAFVVTFVHSGIQPSDANPTCILNCAQCVQLYGEFFDGHQCAQVCIESRGKFEGYNYIDCADPTSIARFIKT